MNDSDDIADAVLNALNAALLVAGTAFIIAEHPNKPAPIGRTGAAPAVNAISIL